MSERTPVTGDPVRDNWNRNAERDLTRIVETAFIIKSKPGRIARKRKKTMYKLEREYYRELILDVARILAAKS